MGIDVGSSVTKGVLLLDGQILSNFMLPTGTDLDATAGECVRRLLSDRGLTQKDILYTVSTGYGRTQVKEADRTITEITCHGRGAKALVPRAELVIDIGGQDSKVIRLDEDGMVADFVMNDKCAAGTGRFLEVMAERLGMSLLDFGRMWKTARKPASISSTCTVFAESEAISKRYVWLRHLRLSLRFFLFLSRREVLTLAPRGLSWIFWSVLIESIM
jgi:predicted CoA-substrate-specific enzyme activase